MSAAGPHIAIIAGEASGDNLGAGLIAALRKRLPAVRFSGVAGPLMRRHEVEVLARSEALGVMGLAEVVRHLPRLLMLRRRLIRLLARLQPDVVVGIDSPDFNLPLEKALRRRGLRTVHYVSPSVWAWRPRRVHAVARAADEVLSLLPFETDFYTGTRVPVSYVGHPLADSISMETDKLNPRRALDISGQQPVVALLPGSRAAEVSRLAGPFLQTALWLARRLPALEFIVPLAGRAAAIPFKRALQRHGEGLVVRLLEGRAREAIAAADAVLCASGTVTLETLLLKRPMVVAYRVSPATAWLLHNMGMLKTRYVSLPNLLAGEELVPECLQQRAVPEIMGPAMLRLLQQGRARAAQVERFYVLHERLRRGADERAAEAVAELALQP
jgi:lipid-A-disaccharide synthase